MLLRFSVIRILPEIWRKYMRTINCWKVVSLHNWKVPMKRPVAFVLWYLPGNQSTLVGQATNDFDNLLLIKFTVKSFQAVSETPLRCKAINNKDNTPELTLPQSDNTTDTDDITSTLYFSTPTVSKQLESGVELRYPIILSSFNCHNRWSLTLKCSLWLYLWMILLRWSFDMARSTQISMKVCICVYVWV